MCPSFSKVTGLINLWTWHMTTPVWAVPEWQTLEENIGWCILCQCELQSLGIRLDTRVLNLSSALFRMIVRVMNVQTYCDNVAFSFMHELDWDANALGRRHPSCLPRIAISSAPYTQSSPVPALNTRNPMLSRRSSSTGLPTLVVIWRSSESVWRGAFLHANFCRPGPEENSRLFTVAINPAATVDQLRESLHRAQHERLAKNSYWWGDWWALIVLKGWASVSILIKTDRFLCFLSSPFITSSGTTKCYRTTSKLAQTGLWYEARLNKRLPA